MNTKRVIWLIIDSVGIGALPDAKDYGDEGSNTLENICRAVPGININNLEKLGIGNIQGVSVIPKVAKPLAAHGKSDAKSPGKDTTTGHWEMAGIILDNPFPTFSKGFPESFISEFEEAIGRQVLGNYPESGTVIIQDLGDEHVKTGKPIVYTSADSVFQIAAHEDVIPVDKLYEICTIAREMLTGDINVGRVIARPFIGTSGNYKRTDNRHDFSLKPTAPTVLDKVKEKGLSVMAVGKINDIFAGQGITDILDMKDNDQGINQTIKFLKSGKSGLIFTNLVDFDMKYGHRNNVIGYAKALEDFDKRIPEIISMMNDDDVLIINSDHGCDPTTESTDHSREYIPILVYGKNVKNVNLGIRSTFADIGATICELLQTEKIENGESFFKDIIV